MASQSLLNWQNRRGTELDEIAQAHALVGGTSRGRRTATQQINYAYAALLSSQFQGFCRDLHSECVDHLVAVLPVNFQTFLRAELVRDRKLDKGNPNPGNIGADFNRLGVYFWTDVKALRPANDKRQAALEELNTLAQRHRPPKFRVARRQLIAPARHRKALAERDRRPRQEL